MCRYKSLLFAAFIASLAFSCGEKQPEEASLPLAVTPQTLSIQGLGDAKTLSIVSATDWYARVSDSWIRLGVTSGKASKTGESLSVSFDENKAASSRKGTITVSNLGKETVVVEVTQAEASDTPVTYGISTAEDLLGFAKAVNGEGAIAPYLVNGVATIMNDIDASSIKDWVPIGTEASPLVCNLDGGNHTISNVNWNVDASKYKHAGFIGNAKGVTIEKLKFGSEGSSVHFVGNPAEKLRAGGFVGYATGCTLTRLTNNANLYVESTSATGNNLIIGGIAGYADQNSILGDPSFRLNGCVNNGNIFVKVPAQEGGIIGYSSGVVNNCTNNGCILGKKDGSYGPGWGCSYNKAKANFVSNYGYGHVGDYDKYVSNPTDAPSDAIINSMMNYSAAYDMDANYIDWTRDSYYDWTEVEKKQLHSGVYYAHYSFDNVPRHMHVVEIDLKDTGIELTSAVADEIIPNPNGNGNSNNGFNLRETLSQLCSRRRAEGQKILAGFNCCFFDSNDGISRGFHVEDGHPVYINNPEVVKKLTNHLWGFTVFTDGTASCGKKKFTGKLKAAGQEYSWYTLNDTTMRHISPDVSPVNLYNSRYVQYPHPQKTSLVNRLAANALYVVCEWTSGEMGVNTGYAPAKVVQVLDGRSTPLTSLPYITDKNRIGIALSGTDASALESLKAGDTVEISCQISVGGDASKPVYSMDSTMYQLLTDGEDTSNSPGASSTLLTAFDPMTFPVVSQDGSKVWLVEVDGRQLWYSLGIKSYEMYRIARKLGGWNATRMDGGGSSTVWIWDSSKGSGSVVNRPCDSKGERSCMTYVLLREK
ncbi:MAG: phosphodiester glycosidase family protein [Bacteroidales bacterium]|nr:phosphodiester glycosidase family protein [Bacteroidales bacterium]